MSNEADKYTWFDTTNELVKVAQKKRVPIVGAFELTAMCNLNCKMCYVRHDAGDNLVLQREKTAEDWIRLGEQTVKAGTLFLLLTGGEPFLRADFREIYSALNRMGFIITIYTNATLITPETIDWLAKIPPNKVGVTLYGASPETYEAVTGSRAAFEKTMRGIDLLLSAGIKVSLRTTIIRENVRDIEAMDVIAKERNLQIQHVLTLVNAVRGANAQVEKERLSPEEIMQIEIKDIALDEECEPVYKVQGSRITDSKEPMFCSAGKSSYWVSWDGRILPCALMNEPYALPFESAFLLAWEKLKVSTAGIDAPEECNSCKYRPYCSVCPAKLQAETGSFKTLSPFICEMGKRVYERLF